MTPRHRRAPSAPRESVVSPDRARKAIGDRGHTADGTPTALLPYLAEFEDILARYTFDLGCIQATDGYPLHTYEFGKVTNDAFVLMSAIGTSALMMLKLASHLAESAYAICYEHRGSPYLRDAEEDRPISISEYVDDVKRILETKNIARPHLIGHCSSAKLIAWAVAHGDLDAKSVTLCAPADVGTSSQELYARQIFFPLLRKVSTQSDEDARKTVDVIQKLAAPRRKKDINNSDVQRITFLNIRDYASTRRYSHLLCGVEMDDGDGARLFDEMCARVPVMLIHACDDQAMSFTCSVDAVRRNIDKRLKLALYAAGTHFLPYTAAQDVARDVGAFVQTLDAIYPSAKCSLRNPNK